MHLCRLADKCWRRRSGISLHALRCSLMSRRQGGIHHTQQLPRGIGRALGRKDARHNGGARAACCHGVASIATLHAANGHHCRAAGSEKRCAVRVWSSKAVMQTDCSQEPELLCWQPVGPGSI